MGNGGVSVVDGGVGLLVCVGVGDGSVVSDPFGRLNAKAKKLTDVATKMAATTAPINSLWFFINVCTEEVCVTGGLLEVSVCPGRVLGCRGSWLI